MRKRRKKPKELPKELPRVNRNAMLSALRLFSSQREMNRRAAVSRRRVNKIGKFGTLCAIFTHRNKKAGF
jgi:hypothetical protein